MKAEEKNRIQWIDCAKGILIITVVIGHVVTAYRTAGLFKESVLWTGIVNFIYSFHMALFVMLSGYLHTMGNKQQTCCQKVISRLIAYGIPYISFSILYWIIKLLFSSFAHTVVNPVDILFIFLKPFGYLWFLYAVMIMQVIQDLLGTNIRKRNRYVHLAIAFSLMVIQSILTKQFGSDFSDYGISDVMKYYIFFTIGEYFGTNIIDYLKNIKRKTALIVTTFLTTIGGSIIINVYPYTNNSVTRFFLALCGSLMIIAVSQKIRRNCVLESVGILTLPIYLLHDYFIVVARIVMQKIGLNTIFLCGIVPLVVCTILGLCAPIVTYQILNRIGIAELIFYPTKFLRRRRKCSQ